MVAINQEARMIGYVLSIEKEEDILDTVLKEFRDYLTIMGKEAAYALPEHCSYTCKIELKGGEAAPWGPIYPLLE